MDRSLPCWAHRVTVFGSTRNSAATSDGVYACTHAWWGAEGPADDPFAPDQAVLAASRARILAVANVIVPGHGPAFEPDASTPR